MVKYKLIKKKEWNGRKELIYRYRYTNKIPLKDGDDSLQVNWCEVTIINKKTEEITYKNSFITNHKINDRNVEKIVKAGRSRWKAVRPRVGDRRKGIVLKDTPTDMRFIRERAP